MLACKYEKLLVFLDLADNKNILSHILYVYIEKY